MTTSALSFRDEHLRSSDGLDLRLRVAEVEAPIADVLLTHGLGEYSGRYGHVAAALGSAGIRLWSYDLRGHGLSGGKQGDASDYGFFVDDLGRMVERVKSEGSELFLMGHSLGGQITLSYLLQRGSAGVSGAVILSPWLRLAFVPPKWRVALAKAALFVLPGLRQRTPSDATQLSRDLEHLAAMPNPELCHDVISGRLFFAIENAGAQVLQRAPEFQVPLLLIHGADDSVTCRKSTEHFHERVASSDKTLIIYPEARHETHNDLGRERVLADITDWIRVRAGIAAQE